MMPCVHSEPDITCSDVIQLATHILPAAAVSLIPDSANVSLDLIHFKILDVST